MNDNAKKWVKALRSGEWSQANGVLRNNEGGYCCLGVACELYHEEHPDESHWENKPDGTSYFYDASNDPSYQYLPDDVIGWLGITSNDGAYSGGAENFGSLAGLNDIGESFDIIADAIENNQEELFFADS